MHGLVACGLVAAGLTACGEPRQDASEPRGNFNVSVRASFPGGQALAKRSVLSITVRNEEARRTIPNVAVTVRGFNYRTSQPNVADPSRPVFALNGEPQSIGGFPESRDASPRGGDTAYVDTWALGALRPGRSKTFRWEVTAVVARKYRLRYTVSAGLNGKARAKTVSGATPRGQFAGTISNAAPRVRVGEDGQSIIQGTR